MKLFISWSGPTSHQVAKCLRDWLPLVIQVISPFVSSEDIEEGARWNQTIARALEDCKEGLIIVTRENLDRPWLNFEAGTWVATGLGWAFSTLAVVGYTGLIRKD